MTSEVVLVDGNNFLYRAYYSTLRQDFRSSKGIPTGAIKTYINMLAKLQKMFTNASFAVVFDAPHGKSFRNDLYIDYKANRKPMPEDLRVQVPIVKEIITNLGMPIITVENVEADDVIGSYAKQATDNKIRLYIASGDKDLAALVNDYVLIVDTMNDVILDEDKVIEKFGVQPRLIRDFLTLKGDAVDNIPGMTGIGDKTAIFLLNNIGSIEEIEKNLDSIKNYSFRGAKTFADNYLSQKEQIDLSKKLTTIKLDVELPISINDFGANISNHSELLRLYREYEFKDLIKKEEKLVNLSKDQKEVDLDGTNIKSKDELKKVELKEKITNNKKLVLVDNLEKFNIVIKSIKEDKFCYIYVYDDYLHYKEASIIGLALSTSHIRAYIPLSHNYLGFNLDISKENLLDGIKIIFEDENINKRSIDSKRIMHLFSKYNITIKNIDDLLVINHLIDTSKTCSIDDFYDYLKQEHVDNEFIKEPELLKGFSNINIDVCNEIGNLFLISLEELYEAKLSILEQSTELKKIYNTIEKPLVDVLFSLESNGITVNSRELQKQGQQLRTRLEDIEQKIYQISESVFNINSPKQVGELLYEKMKLPILKKTAQGKPSTSEEVISQLATTYEVPRMILEYRAINKLLTTYVEKLPNIINNQTGRVHCIFNQLGTITGRLSSQAPNLQNIPVRTDDGRAVRKSFVPQKGFKLLAADYSQIELRVMAHMANEKQMQLAFEKGIDIHRDTASQMYGVSLDMVTPELRRSAKAINFGLIYGMSAFGLANQLGIENKVAKNYIEKYFAQYPNIKKYMDETKESLYKNEYVETLTKRKIFYSGVSSVNKKIAAAIERAAINAPIQGTAADIIKLAMISVYNWIKTVEPNSINLLLQVHDELVFEIKEDKVEEYSQNIKELMENVISLSVPLIVDIGIGDNWSEAH